MTGLARGGVAGVGLELAASPASSAQPLSVVVAGVVEGSPAQKAGVLTGDVLSAVDGEEVTFENGFRGSWLGDVLLEKRGDR